MNILVTGANGQLGNEMRIIAKRSKNSFFFTDVMDASQDSITMLKNLSGGDTKINTDYLDITQLDEVRKFIDREKIKVIVNCAAYTNVDAAEDNYSIAEQLNNKAPENLAIAMKEVDGLLVHISTDYVFGGDPYNTPCKEEQKGTPTGVYGLTKLHGEQSIQQVGCKHIIIRTSWLYSEFGKNFVKTMLNLISTKPQLKVVFDQVGTPTFAFDLANTILDIIECEIDDTNYGIYNYSNEGVTSWYDFTKHIAEITNNTKCDVLPCHSFEFTSKVKRPSYSVLDKTKIKETFGIKIPYWLDSLKICINHLKEANN